MPADYERLPRARPRGDGQEEVYLALGGSGWIDVEGERVDLDADTFVRVGRWRQAQGLRRAPTACRCSSIGGCPGEAYKIAPISELSAAGA